MRCKTIFSNNHKKGKHIERKYHIVQDIVARGDVIVAKIDSANNLADPFTKVLPQMTFKISLIHVRGCKERNLNHSSNNGPKFRFEKSKIVILNRCRASSLIFDSSSVEV